MTNNRYFVIQWTGAWGMETPCIINANSRGECWKKILHNRQEYNENTNCLSAVFFDLECKYVSIQLHDNTIEWIFDTNSEKNDTGKYGYSLYIKNMIEQFADEHHLENRYEWTYQTFKQIYNDLVRLFFRDNHIGTVYLTDITVLKIGKGEHRDWITYTWADSDKRVKSSNIDPIDFTFTMNNHRTQDDNDEFFQISYKLSELEVVN
jgi:hypothetical protein